MGYEPKHQNNKIKCPLKFAYPEIEQECIGSKCAWWMPIQRACAINVNARSYGYLKNKD
jgi:hypothetical protein